ncbi:MAG: PolC-type DNA polymerase III [Firmicutes bacterium]|nr:PolC-type DNA polymerase III [Bacillota bacterium]
MEELILRYIDAKELGFPEGETPRLQVDRAVFKENEGRLEIGLTSNFVVPSYVLDVVKDSICHNIEGVRDVTMDFNYENLVEVVIPKAAETPRENGTTKIRNLRISNGRSEIEGIVLGMDVRRLKSGKSLLTLQVTDYTETILVKKFLTAKQAEKMPGKLHKGCTVLVSGDLQYDEFEKSNIFMARKVSYSGEAQDRRRVDTAIEKRIELHAHTKLSKMDGMTDPKALVKRAAEWGHEAVAITDHGVVQAFPDAMHAAEDLERKGKKIKILYGMEGYLVNDVDESDPIPLDSEFVVFDIETTGFSPVSDEIIEIGAVRVKGREVQERFQTFVHASLPIPERITELTGITDQMLEDAPGIRDALQSFLRFCGDAVLAAHNSSFDMSFIREKAGKFGMPVHNREVDTLYLSRALLTELKRHNLAAVARHLDISQTHHHRADDDAWVASMILLKCMDMLEAAGIGSLTEADKVHGIMGAIKSRPSYHIVLFAKNREGLKNLYKLVSLSHLEYFYRRPRIPKSVLLEYREGLLIGSACQAGEVYQSLLNGKSYEECLKTASFYDYLELQPRENNLFLTEGEEKRLGSEEDLIAINKTILDLARDLDKPVAATSDTHYLDPEEAIYRQILMKGMGFEDVEGESGLYFRTTDEMLEEFAYLGEDMARKVVIDGPKEIADAIEDIRPVPLEKYPPKIENSEQDLREMCFAKAHSIYGDPLPEIVEKRLERELNSIIGNGYSVMYIIAHKLVAKSLSDDYVVGSRGSVGSSLAATMSGITEVNPLPPHYICPKCKHSDFDHGEEADCGVDLPDRNCPICGTPYIKEGFNLPFEVFLGFKGDKEPDIDLNFAGEYQPTAHKFIEELFGEEHVFRAGTIGTVADKTAFGFVKKYFEEMKQPVSKWEVNRLAKGCVGVKRTTGQHPGGIIVVPKENDIHEFCPVQHPADDTGTDIITTHFDYHSIDSNLLKLDILGHDGPSIIKMLKDITGVDPMGVPLRDERVNGLFLGTETLGLVDDRFTGTKGSLGIPEFGTGFVMQMLEDTKPKTFADLVKIAGLSHGTDVWLNNAQEIVLSGTAEFKDVISVRDDILNYLLKKGLEPSKAFKIMENVRKGKGVKGDEAKYMQEHDVPDWYIESCRRIKYMFPKAHAVAYVMLSYRIAWFKVYYPQAFYAAYFTMKVNDFNYEVIMQGIDAIQEHKRKIEEKGRDATPKENAELPVMDLALEMYCRGFEFMPVNLLHSDAVQFRVEEDKVLPPFSALSGVGENAARSLYGDLKENGMFFSIEEMKERTGLNRTAVKALEDSGVLKGIPKTDQLSFF